MKQPGKRLAKKSQRRLEVFTLGRFLVRHGDEVLSEDSNRSVRLWDLFKYLVTYRNKVLLPESIMEALWPDEEYSDPKRTLRNLIYRLRNSLPSGEGTCSIAFSHGGYTLTTDRCWLDTEEFENTASTAHLLAAEDPPAAIDHYMRALSLYKGDYLRECPYKEWVLPARNHYRYLYLQSVAEVTLLLRKMKRFSDIVNLCETAFAIEPFEEDLHIPFMQALLEMGRIKQARAHYEYITAQLYSELGVKPSPAMREIYRLIKAESGSIEMDLTSIQESLTSRRDEEGAFFCDPEIFRHVYKLEQRRGERTGQAVFVGLLTITRSDFRMVPRNTLREAMEYLKQLLMSSLRRGDVVSWWNDAQFIVILPGLNMEQAKRVLRRFEGKFHARYSSEDIVLRAKIQSLLPPDEFVQEGH